jgi:hypothetical protein
MAVRRCPGDRWEYRSVIAMVLCEGFEEMGSVARSAATRVMSRRCKTKCVTLFVGR